MSAISATYNERTRRAYISMGAFNDDIYTYTTSMNPTTYVTTGALSAVSGADASTCPQGRFLYENGKKLFPDAHPGITTYMVGVFDPVSFLSGFIDPNSEKFTLMNTDKPVDQASSTNTFGTNPTTTVSDLAQPVYTRGDILAGGSGDISGTLTVGLSLNVGATTTITNGNLIMTNGKLFLDAVGTNPVVGTATMNVAPFSNSGSYRYKTVATTAVTASSIILITNRGQSNAGTIYSIENVVAGVSFDIVSNNLSDASPINWLIIN